MEQIVVLLFAVFLLQLSETKGASPGTPVFVETGKDLFLQVNKQVTLGEGEDLIWRFNDSKAIGKSDGEKTIFYGVFKGRAELNGQNYSLLLKSVQHSDSGDYTAQVSGENIRLVAGYKVTVQDPVSPVQLTVNSSSSCNVTVTCSTVDSHISSTFRCDTQTCSQEGGERSEVKTHPSSINVYVKHGHIICNHRNQVSWKQDKKQIELFCQPDPVTAGVTGIAIGASAGAVVGIAALMTVLFIKYKKKNNSSTVYEVPQDIKPAQTLNENPTEDASGLSPTSTYCLVTFHTGPGESSKTKNTPKPETVYAQVNRAAKTNCRSHKNQHQDLETTDQIYLQD